MKLGELVGLKLVMFVLNIVMILISIVLFIEAWLGGIGKIFRVG